MINKRGQAALEFLTTYGWAFLVILIMISALSYFGVLTPSNFLPERCHVASEFTCEDYIVTETTQGSEVELRVNLQNNVGDTITVNSVNVTSTSEADATACTPTSQQVGSAQAQTFTCDVTGNFPAAGEKVRLGFTIDYQKAGGQFDHVASGEVFATIQG